VDIWTARTLAVGDGWIAAMTHIALESRCYVIGVNPCVHIDQIPADFPHRDRVWRIDHDGEWVEPGNIVIIDPTGKVLAGPARREETILYADITPAAVRAARRYFDPVGHYHRPDIFQLSVDTRPRTAVVVRDQPAASAPATTMPPMTSYTSSPVSGSTGHTSTKPSSRDTADSAGGHPDPSPPGWGATAPGTSP
jgi:hypothetical protein